MHPLLCGAALVDAVIGITPSKRSHIGPTNDTRRDVRTEVPERRLLLASVVWEQSLDKRPLLFWRSGMLGQRVMSWGQG